MTSNHLWEVIVNPNAGRKKGARDWQRIAGLLDQYGFQYRTSFTEGCGDAITLTRAAIQQGGRYFIVVGGDGTMNEVVNGILLQKEVASKEFVLGMISVGTGNDWGRMFDVPTDYEGAIKIIREGRVFLQDAGLVTYNQDGEVKQRYFLNIAGLGFDAVVVHKTNKKKENRQSGMMIYMKNLLTTLASYRHTHTRIHIDESILIDDVFTISIGIGKYTGGGMMQTPHALADDGYFDLTVVRRMGKMEIIRSLKRLYDGTILEHPRVSGFRGKKISIESNPPIKLEVDGESLGESPIGIQILPREIQVITGNGFASVPANAEAPVGLQKA